MTDVEELDPPEPEPESPNPNAATGAGVKLQREKLKGKDRDVAEFWQTVLRDKTGRAEIWRILQSGGVFTTPFAIGPNGFPQPEATWARAGQQALVLGEYHRLMRLDLDGVRLMLTEHDPAFKKAE